MYCTCRKIESDNQPGGRLIRLSSASSVGTVDDSGSRDVIGVAEVVGFTC